MIKMRQAASKTINRFTCARGLVAGALALEPWASRKPAHRIPGDHDGTDRPARAGRLTAYRDAFADMGRPFDFIDQRHGVIFDRDAARTARAAQQLVRPETERAGARSRRQVG